MEGQGLDDDEIKVVYNEGSFSSVSQNQSLLVPDQQQAPDRSPENFSTGNASIDSENAATDVKNKRRSEMHKHFKESNDSFVCNYCRKILKKDKTSSTGNLKKHLDSQHKSIVMKKESQSSSLAKFLSEAGTKNVKKFDQKEFEDKLLQFILLSDQPFTIVENEYFKAMILYTSHEAKLPSADSIRRKIFTLFEEEKQQLAAVIKNIPGKPSFALDCWTSANQISFQGVIIQWISKKWELRERILDLDILTGPHTGKNLANSFQKVLREFNLENRLLAITTDNASNCDTFFAEVENYFSSRDVAFSQSDSRVRCLAHIINLACQDTISTLKSSFSSPGHEDLTQNHVQFEGSNEENSVDTDNDDASDHNVDNTSTIGKLRKGIIKIRKSTQRRETFKRNCGITGTKHNELVKDMPTRWNSSYYMLKRALQMKIPFDCTLRKEKASAKLLLTDIEWETISNIVSFLKPFKKLTTQLSQQKIPTMSISVMVYMELYNNLESFTAVSGHSNLTIDAAKNACDKLNKYYPGTDGLVYVIGTILDPRCKFAWYGCHSSYFPAPLFKSYRKAIRTCWETFYKPAAVTENCSNQDSKKTDNSNDLFSKQMKKPKAEKRDELQMYLDEKVVTPDTVSGMKNTVLGWWKIHEPVYPNLSKMARDFLAVSGTGVPVERLFSSGTDLLAPKHLSMKAETTRRCMCLKGWIKSKNQEEFANFVSKSVTEKMLGNQ